MDESPALAGVVELGVDDAFAALTALERWRDQCEPTARGHLERTIAQVRARIDVTLAREGLR